MALKTTEKIALGSLLFGVVAAAFFEYIGFNRTLNVILSLIIAAGVYGETVKLSAAENVANSKKL